MQVLKELIIDENNVAFLPSVGSSFQLNETAKEIINFLKQGYSKEDIIKNLQEKYDVDEDTLFVDLNDFLAKLKVYGF